MFTTSQANNSTKQTSSEEQLQKFFHQMLAIRLCEEKLLALFSKGLIRGTIHTCLGQEGCSVGVMSALDRERDIICSNHRGHGHFLAYSFDFKGLIAEIIGLPNGVCGGVGGSQHLHWRNFYSNGILGGMPPVAVGMAAAEKRLGSKRVVCVFLGDGAMAEGSLYESMNIAALWKLPIIFAVEHNQYAQSTHWSQQHAGQLEKRAESFGIPVTEVDGNRVAEVHHAARACLRSAREDCLPAMLFMHTYRLGAHSKGEDHREQSELATFRKKDPLVILRSSLGEEWCAAQQTELSEKLDVLIKQLIENN